MTEAAPLAWRAAALSRGAAPRQLEQVQARPWREHSGGPCLRRTQPLPGPRGARYHHFSAGLHARRQRSVANLHQSTARHLAATPTLSKLAAPAAGSKAFARWHRLIATARCRFRPTMDRRQHLPLGSLRRTAISPVKLCSPDLREVRLLRTPKTAPANKANAILLTIRRIA